jgi:hypothetical protein
MKILGKKIPELKEKVLRKLRDRRKGTMNSGLRPGLIPANPYQ